MIFTAQLFGIGAMIALFCIYQQQNRKHILFAKLTADICWVVHYLCLGGIAGMIPNLVGIFREVIFLHRKEKRWASHIIWPILFILLNWTLGFRTFHTFFNLLPITASTFVTISLWIDNPRLTKLISLPVSLSFGIYNACIGSYVGILNESIAICSILLSFIKERGKTMEPLFLQDCKTEHELVLTQGAPITNVQKKISTDATKIALEKGKLFADEIKARFVSDFEHEADKMAHVSTFVVADGYVFMSYYANTKAPDEDPKNQTARLVYAPLADIEDKTFLDLQTTGDIVDKRVVDMVYDTILMQKDENTLHVMWTARIDENYYRFYCPFYIREKKLGKIGVNRFCVANTTNDFSTSGIQSALAANNVPCKKMFSDIGIMQKLSVRMENGIPYYYTGAYSGDFTCIIKSYDLITWEYVAQPDFINDSKWENATYVLGDKCFYFVRQQDLNPYGFLTVYDLNTGKWEMPIEIADCQSRSDFIFYKDALYLFHAPIDREHIGIVKIDTENIANSETLLQAHMHSSCFYPFVQYYKSNSLAMSYTVARKHIRLAQFDFDQYID